MSVTSEIPKSILQLQSNDGRFNSFVIRGNKTEADGNGFTTALVLRELRRRFGTKYVEAVHAKAFNYLQKCASQSQQGAYRFWPVDTDPFWCTDLTDDADDTAVILLEQYLYGLLSADEARNSACHALINHRTKKVDQPSPSWIVPGAFKTMLSFSRPANPVDCCVNANIVALFAALDLKSLPGYNEACELIIRAVAWSGNNRFKALCTTPYYANPAELFYAISNAVELGADELIETKLQLEQRPWITCEQSDANQPVYGRVGSVHWTAPALHYVRQIPLANILPQ